MECIIANKSLDLLLDKIAELCAKEMQLSVEDFKDKYKVEISKDFVSGPTILRTYEVHRMSATVSGDDLRTAIEALAKMGKEE